MFTLMQRIRHVKMELFFLDKLFIMLSTAIQIFHNHRESGLLLKRLIVIARINAIRGPLTVSELLA